MLRQTSPAVQERCGKKQKRSVAPRSMLWAARLLLGCMVLLWALSWLDLHVRPVLQAGIRYECQRVANEMFQAALRQQSDALYQGLYTITRNADGSIQTVELDAAAVNRLQSALAAQMQQQMQTAAAARTLHIPLGVLLGGEMWLGPTVALRLAPDAYFAVEISDTLDAAGINQTRLCIRAKCTAYLCATLAGFAASEEVQQEFLLAELVLNGEVPQNYLSS